MKILAVDDENLMLEWLCECITEAAPDAEIIPFRRPMEALEYIRQHKIDVAFLDIQMGGMTGIELGKQIKIEQPIVNIIFCTGYSEHIYDAVTMVRCNGYLLKPINAEQIKEELANLRVPMNYESKDQLYVQCFGNFEVFADGAPVYFEVSKAKELLAYLIDRNGAVCTNDEISAVLWEDGTAHTSYLKKCKKNLIDTLNNIGCKDMVINRWGGMAVNKDKLPCDYYEWLEGTASGINAYHGEYMAQYSWAEFTNAGINRKNNDDL